MIDIDFIFRKEYDLFTKLIKDNSPFFKYILDARYYWKPFRVNPRKAWLREQIKRHSKDI